MRIAGRTIGPDHPTFIIAEMSANHHGDLETALAIVDAAADAGADAVKIQTYTADSLTLDSDKAPFRVGDGVGRGTLWEGETLHSLYEKAATPWEWHGDLFDRARDQGLLAFSSPFDEAAVDLLDRLDAPAYKIASFEIVDTPLIEYTATKGRPMILSTGMATAEEIQAGVDAARTGGCEDLALLRCNSAYPASLDEMDLATIPDMAKRFHVPIGLSDHTLGEEAAVTAVSLGACILEKHIILDRGVPGPDSAFSTEPAEFKSLVRAVRRADADREAAPRNAAAVGTVRYGPTPRERGSIGFRRSLFVVADVKADEPFTRDNVRSIRPGHGLPPARIGDVLGARATADVEAGTPLTNDLLQ